MVMPEQQWCRQRRLQNCAFSEQILMIRPERFLRVAGFAFRAAGRY